MKVRRLYSCIAAVLCFCLTTHGQRLRIFVPSLQDGPVVEQPVTRPRFVRVVPVSKTPTEVIVAIPDSGIALGNKDLQPFLWLNDKEIPDNALDDDNNGCVDDIHGCNAFTNFGDMDDDSGHGTHVAGIVAGIANGALSLDPAKPRIRIMPVKMLDCFGFYTQEALMRALRYIHTVQQQTGLRVVVNASWIHIVGIPPEEIRNILQEFEKAGIVFVAAVGNNYGKFLAYPAAYSIKNVISVAALDKNRTNKLASFSNIFADIAAPGVDIESCKINGGKVKMSGTSMAAPFVTQAVALWLLDNPEATISQIRMALFRSCDREKDLEDAVLSGRRLNAVKFMVTKP